MRKLRYDPRMRLLICGVRGSTPATGPDFTRYGGHTPSIAVTRDGEAPSLVLDGGTGLQRLSEILGDEPFRGTILLGHLHWDHTHGLPFFPAATRPDASTTVVMPAQGDPYEVLGRAFSPPHFPVKVIDLAGSWDLRNLEPGEHSIEGYSVLALDVPHPGGRTFGYRIQDGSRSLAYISDHSPIALGPGPQGFGRYHDAALALGRNVDLLIHDSQYTAEEFPSRSHYGHSAIEYAIGLAEACRAKKLLLFHHDPLRTDEELDRIVDTLVSPGFAIEVAREGSFIDL
jgi:phosphoribosyl 1,2-cyclic phosphodiesterase